MTGRRRSSQAGIGRLLVALVALLLLGLPVLGAIAYVKATTDPDLGPAPRGPLHGRSELQLAGYAAERIGSGLLQGHTHAAVILSEQDVGVVLAAHPPVNASFADPRARAREGLLVVDGRTDVGPVSVHAVGRLAVRLVQGPDGSPDVGIDIREIDAGTLPLPGPLRDRVEERVRESVNLSGLLSSTALAPLRPELDCAGVTPDGVVLGFHAPGVGPDPSTCVPAGQAGR